MEADDSLPHSQKPATLSNHEPAEYSPHPNMLFIEDFIWCHHPNYALVSHVVKLPSKFSD
jgi:hypothetical protein